MGRGGDKRKRERERGREREIILYTAALPAPAFFSRWLLVVLYRRYRRTGFPHDFYAKVTLTERLVTGPCWLLLMS